MPHSNTFYITTPIFYPNANPHMGHAYTTVVCDALARYYRNRGVATYFLTGTDEHTEKVVEAAEKNNHSPQEYLETIVQRFKNLYAILNISYDQFIRTSDREVHWPGVIELWRRMVASGDIYKARYEGLYCIGCEAFLTEKDLVDGLCPLHQRVPEHVSEENYFFRLSKYAEAIERSILSGTMRVLPEARKNEVLSLMRSGLHDVSFSRPKEKMSWGISVPDDPKQMIYIWADALPNYITALGFGRGEERMQFWPGVHVLGKDILRFHAVYWPAMLMSAGLVTPEVIMTHGTITSGGQKMSKSLGNVVDPLVIARRYGTDALRYYLLREVSTFEDSDFTEERFVEAYNANLANGIGNLAARIMKMAEKYLDSPVVIPDDIFDEVIKGEYAHWMERFSLQRAADVVWERIAELDAYIQETQPFKTISVDENKAKNDIVHLVSGLAGVAHMLTPFIPQTAEKIKNAIAANRQPETLFPRMG